MESACLVRWNGLSVCCPSRTAEERTAPTLQEQTKTIIIQSVCVCELVTKKNCMELGNTSLYRLVYCTLDIIIFKCAFSPVNAM